MTISDKDIFVAIGVNHHYTILSVADMHAKNIHIKYTFMVVTPPAESPFYGTRYTLNTGIDAENDARIEALLNSGSVQVFEIH